MKAPIHRGCGSPTGSVTSPNPGRQGSKIAGTQSRTGEDCNREAAAAAPECLTKPVVGSPNVKTGTSPQCREGRTCASSSGAPNSRLAAPLAEETPALVELGLQLAESLSVGGRPRPELVLLIHGHTDPGDGVLVDRRSTMAPSLKVSSPAVGAVVSATPRPTSPPRWLGGPEALRSRGQHGAPHARRS